METNGRTTARWSWTRLFFLVNFTQKENYNKALHEGPWFISGHFLAIRQWQPCFSFTALWVRLPELPTKFYDLAILTKIGNVIGQLLGMNVCTQNAKRCQYARLCIQVPLDLPLITSVFIGKFHQKVLYKRINLLCYHCGKIGRSNLSCAYKHLRRQLFLTKRPHPSNLPLTIIMLHLHQSQPTCQPQ